VFTPANKRLNTSTIHPEQLDVYKSKDLDNNSIANLIIV